MTFSISTLVVLPLYNEKYPSKHEIQSHEMIKPLCENAVIL